VQKVIENEGNNTFLQKKGGLHCEVRADFMDTPAGIWVRKK
jgi:hypothetical protein